MKKSLLNLLQCPGCGGNLRLETFNIANEEIIEGILYCECNSIFPIVDCVPRFIDDGLVSFPEFIEKYRDKIKVFTDKSDIVNTPDILKSKENYDNILKSFSAEWNIFNYDDDKTWGWEISERQEVFIDDMGLDNVQLQGKLLLDAGCGNGSMTAALSDLGMEVVGLDLHMGLGKAHENKSKFAKNGDLVHFVQGNLFKPPFKKDIFNLIYCSGVIHHTPDSKATFDKILPLTKKGGRAYFWVYKKRGLPVHIFMSTGRWLNKHFSLKTMFYICRSISPFFKIAADLLSFSKIMEFRKRNTKEITLDLFDAFTPKYNRAHSPDEVKNWFSEHNFSNITVSGIQKHGFGVYGDK